MAPAVILLPLISVITPVSIVFTPTPMATPAAPTASAPLTKLVFTMLSAFAAKVPCTCRLLLSFTSVETVLSKLFTATFRPPATMLAATPKTAVVTSVLLAALTVISPVSAVTLLPLSSATVLLSSSTTPMPAPPAALTSAPEAAAAALRNVISLTWSAVIAKPLFVPWIFFTAAVISASSLATETVPAPAPAP